MSTKCNAPGCTKWSFKDGQCRDHFKPPTPAAAPDAPADDSCSKCGKAFGNQEAAILVNGVKIHKECNVKYCAKCKGIVAGAYVGSGGAYFHKECAGLTGVCRICGQPLNGAMANVKGGRVHAKCLVCSTCGKNVVSGYLEDADAYYCGPCYELKHPPIVEEIPTKPSKPVDDGPPSGFLGSLLYSAPKPARQPSSQPAASPWSGMGQATDDKTDKDKDKPPKTKPAPPPVRVPVYVMEGTLLKKGEKMNKAFKERFFGIEDGKLSYMKGKGGKPLGVIDISGSKVVLLPPEGRAGALFGLTPASGRMYVLEANNDAERDKWTQQLTTAGATMGEYVAPAPAAPKTPTTPPKNYTTEGSLLKKGEKNKAWKERFFGVDEGKLEYMKGKNDKSLGVIELKGAKLILLPAGEEGKAGFLFSIAPPNAERVYVLEASSETERSRWSKALITAGATQVDYVAPVAPVYVIEGVLLKKGEKNTAFKERFFGIENTKLSYMKTRGTKELGFIELKGAKLTLLPPGEEGKVGSLFSLTPPTGERTYVLEAINETERSRWTKELLAAGATQIDYVAPVTSAVVPTFSIEGVLLKKGEKNTAWKPRFFGIENTKLSYMKTRGTKELGFIELKGAKVIHVPAQDEQKEGKTGGSVFLITPPAGERTYILEAPSESERARWSKAMVSAGAVQSDYVPPPAPATPIYSKEGPLFKKGEKNTAWKDRFCGIDHGKLSYMKSKGAKELGSLQLKDSKVVLYPTGHEGRPGSVFGITPASGDRTYILEAPNDAEREQWVSAAKSSGAIPTDYTPPPLKKAGKSSAAVIRKAGSVEGMLKKKGDKNKAWKDRYCVVDDTKLVYATSEGAKRAGDIELVAARLFILPAGSEGREGFLFGIIPNGLTRMYMFEASSDAERTRWTTPIKELTERGSTSVSSRASALERSSERASERASEAKSPKLSAQTPKSPSLSPKSPSFTPKSPPSLPKSPSLGPESDRQSKNSSSVPALSLGGSEAKTPKSPVKVPPRTPGLAPRPTTSANQEPRPTTSGNPEPRPSANPEPQPTSSVSNPPDLKTMEAQLADAVAREDWDRCVELRDAIMKFKKVP